MNIQRNTSVSSASSAEDIMKIKDDNPFDDAFIDQLTMMHRGRMDSIAGGSAGGTLNRRHSFSHMDSVQEEEEILIVVPSVQPPSHDRDEDKTVSYPTRKLGVMFTRKRSLSAGELTPADTQKDVDIRRRHVSG